ncbi:MAG: hypothetical protein J6Z16_04035 [Candidatus Methanomethylophilaceae archaeon]|nr:hypothetical protein [Candidatus Methanomethylophilaceae archaeon]
MDPGERAAALRRAESLLNEAAGLMDAALHMSGLEGRSGDDSETIRRIASSDSYGGSLRNLARDLEYESAEQPVWTQPLTSPKNQRFRLGR